jgi:hypothetical protein
MLTCAARYNLVTEQKKGSYQYFVDLGDRMEAAKSRTMYVDEVCHLQITVSDRSLRSTTASRRRSRQDKDRVWGQRWSISCCNYRRRRRWGGEFSSRKESEAGAKGEFSAIPSHISNTNNLSQPFYTPEEITSFRTMGLETGLYLYIYHSTFG